MMLSSLQTRIILVVTGIVLVTALSLLLTGQWQTRKFLLKEENEKALTLLRSMVFAVDNEYQSMCFFRNYYLQHTKVWTKDMVDAAMEVVAAEYQRCHAGAISVETAQKYCIDTLRKFRYDNGNGYFWITEQRQPYPIMAMHAMSPRFEGQGLDNPFFYCVIPDNRNLFQVTKEICDRDGGGSAEYTWPKDNLLDDVRINKFTYFRLFKPWKWIIGTGFLYSNVEQAVAQRLDAVIKELQDTVKDFRIGENGYFFIFSGNNTVLVHPTDARTGMKNVVNPDTGRILAEEISQAYKKGQKKVSYRWEKPFANDSTMAWKVVHCEYYAPLDWYICVSYYLDDVEKPITALNIRLLMLSAVLLFVALVTSIILSASLVAPLRRLAVAAETIDREGIDEMAIPVTGSAETQELGLVLNRALTTIRNKENSLKASEENLRITLSSIGDAVMVTDIEGRIIRMNNVAENLLGWPFNAAKGRVLQEWIKLIDIQTQLPVDSPISLVLHDGEIHRLEGKIVMLRQDGEKRILDGTCAPLRSRGGQMVGAVMACRDVTEQARLAEVLHQGQKMDSLGQLAGGVAHDFNNMLGGIMACADLLRRKFAAENAKIKEYTELIVTTCERAADLTGKLLAFSRKGKVLSTPINLHAVIRDAVVILERSLDKRVLIESHLDAESTTVIGDPSQIQNIIINLGINSGYAMPQGGTVTIRTSNIELTEADLLRREAELTSGNYVEIEFTDTGNGISPEIIGRIFEPFFTTKEAGKGTGLGLAAVYGSVKEHHGAIRVNSQVGMGTTFKIYLPVHDEMEVAAGHQFDIVPSGHGCILLVDDEKIIRTASKGLLEDLGYEVLVAEDGEQGVAIYRENMDKIDVVILDMVMPKMNGADCFYQIRKLNPEAKIFMASGFSGNAVIGTLKQDGLVGFINKPYSSIQIGQILREVLKH